MIHVFQYLVSSHKEVFSLFLLVCINSVFGQGEEKSYKPVKKIDKNGYSYEIYTNDPAGVRVYKLKNGLTVYLAQNFDEPKVRAMIGIRAGSAYESLNNTGVAHYLEHLLFRGNERIGALNPALENVLFEKMALLFEEHRVERDTLKRKIIYRSIDSLSVEASKYGVKGEYHKLLSAFGGSFINAVTQLDMTTYWCTISANYLEPFLVVEKERFSRVPLRSFPTELEIVYEEYNEMQDNISQKKYYGLRKMLYPNHPYGRFVIGFPEHVKSPSMLAVKDYFNKFYVPSNMALTLVGDLDFEKTIQLVDKTFGKISTKPFVKPLVPVEVPIDKPVETEIFSEDEESVTIGFRMKGANSKDAPYVRLIDMLLNNGSAGLMDLALNTSGKINNVNSLIERKQDYSTHEFTGLPKLGQSLELVKELMLEQIERIKKGDFDESLLKAVIADFKKGQLAKYSDILNLSAEINAAFNSNRNWSDVISLVEQMNKLNKGKIVEFAKNNYTKNYAVVYKRKGAKTNLVKVDKPVLSPILLNQDTTSPFYDMIKKIKVSAIKTQFIDPLSIINQSIGNKGIEISFVENRRNDLFELSILLLGNNENRKDITLAVPYLNMIGTNKYSPAEFKMEFYKFGLEFGIGANGKQVVISLSGLQENLSKGIELINHFMEQAKPDEKTYMDYVNNILSIRKTNIANKNRVFNQGLVNFALYGENSALRDIYSEVEMLKIKPDSLVTLITGMRKFKHEILFYGKDLPTFKSILNKNYNSFPILVQTDTKTVFTKIESRPVVYFVQKEMAQAELMLIKRCDNENKNNFLFSTLFYRYMDDIVNKEIREKKSLAYSAFANYTPASNTNDFDYFFITASTQADKVPETLKGLKDCLLNLPGNEIQFNEIKENVLGRMASKRVTGSNILWDYITAKERGFPSLINKEVYESVRQYTLNDVKQFHEGLLANKDFTLLVMGDKNKIDMKALAVFGEIKEMDINYLFNYR